MNANVLWIFIGVFGWIFAGGISGAIVGRYIHHREARARRDQIARDIERDMARRTDVR